MSFPTSVTINTLARFIDAALSIICIPFRLSSTKPVGFSPWMDRWRKLSDDRVNIQGLIGLLIMASAMTAQAEFNAKQCTAQIKAKNTSPNHDIKIDKLSTAAGPIYAYGSRSPSNPHRVLDNSGDYETWTVELDTQWIDDEGTGCKQNHRVKVDLFRDGNKCSDIKFPYTNGEPSNPKDSFVNPSKGGAIFNIGDLQKAYEDCLTDEKCDCNGPRNQ